MIIVSTDGSALANPAGAMGWAWAEHGSERYDAGGATNGTNQIGELCAVLEALRAHMNPEPLLIESDSQYAINSSTTWLKGWKANGWRNAKRQPVKNRAIIQAIDEALRLRPAPVSFRWVKGHAGNAGNELVDRLAHGYALDCKNGTREGYLPLEGWQALIDSPYAQGLDVPSDVQLALQRYGSEYLF